MSGQKYGYDTDDDPVDENYNDEAISGEEELEEVWDLQGSPIRGLHEEAVEDDEEENVNEELDPIDVAFDEYSAAYLASPVLPYPTPIAVLANNLVPEPYMAFILEEVVASDRHEFAISKPTDIDYQKNHPLAKTFKNSGGGYSKEVAFFTQSKEVSQDRCINRMVHRFHDITGLSTHWHGCRVNDTSRNTYVRGDRNHPVPVMVRRRNEKGETVYSKKTNPQEESQQHALCARGAANAMPASCFYSNYRLVDKDGSDIGPAIGFGSSLHYLSFIESKKENYLFAISDGTLSQASDEHHALHTELDPIIEKISKAKELLKACSEKEPNRRAKLQASLLKLRGQKNALLDKMLEVLSDARLLCRRVDPHNGYFFITWSQRRMIVGFVRLVAAIRCQNCVNFQRFITRDDLGLFYQRTTKRSIPQEFMKAADLHNDGSRNLGSDFVVGPLQAFKGWGLVDMSDREQYIALRNRFKKYRADIDLDRSHWSYRLCKSDDNYSGRTLAERNALETANLEAEAALEALVDTTGPVHQSSNDDEDHAAVPMAKEPSAKKARLDKKKVTKVEVPKKKPTQKPRIIDDLDLSKSSKAQPVEVVGHDVGHDGEELQPFESVAPVILNHVSADYTQNHVQYDENIAMDPTNAKHEDIDMDIDLCNNQSTEVLPDDEIRDVSSSLDKINCSERAGESIDDVKDEPDDDTDAVVETEQKLRLCEAITSDISNIVHTVTEHNRIQDENIVADSYVAGVELPNTVQDKANTGNLDESDGGLGLGITPVITCSADDVNKDDTCNMVENNINKQLDKPSDGSKNKLETGPEAVVDTSTNVTCWDDIVHVYESKPPHRLLSPSSHNHIFVGDDGQQELHCFTFGNELLATTTKLFSDFEKFDVVLAIFASSHSKSLVHIIEEDWFEQLARKLDEPIVRF